MLRFMGSQRVGHDWVTELNWSIVIIHFPFLRLFFPFFNYITSWNFIYSPFLYTNKKFLFLCSSVLSVKIKLAKHDTVSVLWSFVLGCFWILSCLLLIISDILSYHIIRWLYSHIWSPISLSLSSINGVFSIQLS